MRDLPHEVWTEFKNWRKFARKLERFTGHLSYLERCLQSGGLPQGFKLKNKITYTDEDLRKKCQELNDIAARKSLPIIKSWLYEEIAVLQVKVFSAENMVWQVAGETLYIDLYAQINKEVLRERRKRSLKHNKKLDQINNISKNTTNTPTTVPLECRSERKRNRRVNKNSRRRRRNNWRVSNQDKRRDEIKELLKTASEYPLPPDMFEAFNLTNHELTETQRKICSLGLKFVPTVRRYDRVRKWFDIQAFKRKLRLDLYHHRKKSNNKEKEVEEKDEEEQDIPNYPWHPKSSFEPPSGMNLALERFLDKLEQDLMDPGNEKKVKDNLSHEERQALYDLSKWNKVREEEIMIRVQDKGSRIVIEEKERYKQKMLQYLEDTNTFREDEEDQSEEYQKEVKQWVEKWKDSISEEEQVWIQKETVNPGKVYGNIKTHKDNKAYRHIISTKGTAVENLARWLEIQLKDLARAHPAFLQDTKDFLSYIEQRNQEDGPFDKEKIWLISRDIVNYYPSCNTDMCIEAVGQLLDTRTENNPPKECILDALKITMKSNNCEFLGRHFTQIEGATIGGPESASVTDIFGAIHIDKKIMENVIQDDEDWKRYRDDSWSISTNTSKEREEDKTRWMNYNVVKDKIKFTMEASQKQLVFLDTEINVKQVDDEKIILVSDMYSKETDTHQYLSPLSCHPQNQTENIPLTVANRIRCNCSDNAEDDSIFKSRLVEYKAYLMKSGHPERKIDEAFSKVAAIPRSEVLKRKTKKVQNDHRKRLIMQYEPSFPDAYKLFKKYEHILLEDNEMSNIFPRGANHFQVVYQRGGKNIKEWIAGSSINSSRGDQVIQGACSPCGKNCIDCPYLENKGQHFSSTVTKRSYKVRQEVNCESRNIIYLVTCQKCNMQGVGETENFKKRNANYRSNIRNKRITCNIERHFVESEDHNLEHFQIQIIVQLENPPRGVIKRRKRLKQFEGYWQINLCTLYPYGMNSINELEVNLKWGDKNIFYPEGLM